MSTITATATRTDDGWWAVEVPVAGSTQYTQGRTLAEAERMARDVVALVAEDADDPSLADATITLQVAGPAAETARSARLAAAEAEEARRRARTAQAGAVRTLLSGGLTMTDIAHLMGITKGRVSQIAHA